MGFGSNGAFTAMFAIIFQEFDDRAITVLSLSESLVGVGGMVAPLIGGGLYDVSVFCDKTFSFIRTRSTMNMNLARDNRQVI